MRCASQLGRATVVIVLLNLLAVRGCAGDDQAQNALVEYERSGGIAGFTDRLEVRQDGRARIESRRLKETKNVRLPALELRRLRAALRQARFDGLGSDYGSANHPDAIEVSVTHRGKTVRGGALPQRLARALRILARIIDREAYAAPGH